MSLFDQILIKIYSLLVLLVSLFLLVIGSGLFQSNIYDLLDSLYQSIEAQITVIVVAIILLLASIRLLIVGIGRKKVLPSVRQRNDLGETRIAINTLENLANKAIQKVKGVRDWKVRIKTSDIDGNQYFIKVISDGETPIPEMTEQIQQEVKTTVESLAGIEVHQVSVMISDIANSENLKPRRVE